MDAAHTAATREAEGTSQERGAGFAGREHEPGPARQAPTGMMITLVTALLWLVAVILEPGTLRPAYAVAR